jgi:hypothetical protein
LGDYRDRLLTVARRAALLAFHFPAKSVEQYLRALVIPPENLVIHMNHEFMTVVYYTVSYYPALKNLGGATCVK